MKKHLLKITSFGLVAALLAVAAVSVQAQNTSTNAPAKTTAPATVHAIPFRGKVAAVDPGTDTFTIGARTFYITSTTKISNATNGAPAVLADISVGQTVSGSYLKGSNGQLNAKTIHIGVKTTKAKKKKPAPNEGGTTSTNSVPTT